MGSISGIPGTSGGNFEDDDGPIDPLELEERRLRERWKDGIGPRPRWPLEARSRWRELYRERRAAGDAEEDAGRHAVAIVDAELAQAAGTR